MQSICCGINLPIHILKMNCQYDSVKWQDLQGAEDLRGSLHK